MYITYGSYSIKKSKHTQQLFSVILVYFFVIWKQNIKKKLGGWMSLSVILHKKFWYSELFWSAFSHIRTEYGEILHISLYSVQMRENSDQNNFEYGHFSSSVILNPLLKF